MQRHNRILLKVLQLLPLGLIAQAADNSGWNQVRAIHRGDRIGIVQMDHRRVEGRFSSATDSTLVLDNATLLKSDIVRVYTSGISRRKKMLIGAAAGLAAGAVVAATVSQRLNNEGFFGGSGGGAGTTIAVGGGTGIGLATGSLFGGGYKTIYQRPEDK